MRFKFGRLTPSSDHGIFRATMDAEEFRRKQREKIQQAKQRQAVMEQRAQEWDSIVTPMLGKIGNDTWGSAASIRHWHGEWEVYAATPAHPHYRVSLKLDDAGEPVHFVVKSADGEVATQEATEAALAEALERATNAGPAGWS